MDPDDLAEALIGALYREPATWRASRPGDHLRELANVTRFRRELARVVANLPDGVTVLELRDALEQLGEQIDAATA